MSNAGSALTPETYEAADGAGIARVHDFLAAHEATGRDRPAPRYLLAGAEPGDQVELPEEVYLVLRQAVEAMQRGLSVTISPISKTLTTQQAAELLGVSRPTVIKFLNEGQIPFERVGTHRRVTLSDLLEFRKARREEQYAALSALSSDVDEDTPLEAILGELKTARRAVAARRRNDADAS
ncbi:helix-turn-helix domain-containing protein [Agromyces silvae]|uniref:helix-turn-helix domain-containing protein n=1 Tax=Agromyces silvae TaxID=3388266 RepID=UPI00280B2732|nr:helix-turn-helix domain-containing protein [Agromyces protaetiae]